LAEVGGWLSYGGQEEAARSGARLNASATSEGVAKRDDRPNEGVTWQSRAGARRALNRHQWSSSTPGLLIGVSTGVAGSGLTALFGVTWQSPVGRTGTTAGRRSEGVGWR